MRNFWRAVRFAWPYRARLALSLLSGLVVAFFWGANISAILPVLTVLLDKKTLVSWTDERIAHQRQQISEVREQIRQTEVAGFGGSRDADWFARRQAELRSRQNSLAWYEWGRPYLVRYAPSDSFHTLCLVMGLLIGSLVVKSIFDFFQEYLAGSLVSRAVFDLRNQFYRQTMRMDLSAFTDKGTHELTARLTNDIESLSGGMRALFGKVLLEPLKAISCLAFACLFNWRLTLVTLLLFPLAAMLMGVIGRYLKKISRRNLESMSRIYKILQESFLGIRVVKAFAMEGYERRRFLRETRRYFFQEKKLIRTDALGGPLLELLAICVIAMALLAGSYLVLTGETHVWGIRLTYDPIDQAMLLTFYALIAGMCDPLRKVFSVYGRVQRGVAAADRIFQTMDRPNRVISRPSAPQLPRHSRSIEFKNVTFGYSPDRIVLRHVNLRVRFGETIAIVGATGCGKTSLVNLLPRFHDPLEGQIRIDGIDIREVSLKSLRQQMGIVTQNTILFADSAYHNIAYGQRQSDARAVHQAAKAAHAHRFIEELPAGYQTNIGELGNSLSGGQRQRIALARAIFRDPAILILDEATSSLDVESEALIHQALRTFARGRTTFVVTHRLSALDIADRIVVVSEGQIEAIGTHAELLHSSMTYRRLHDVQAKGA